MALFTTMGSENIPEGGIRLTRTEALEFQKKTIRKWKSFTEVAFLQYGWAASSAVTFISSAYITNLIRSLLNMGSRLKLSSNLLLPSIPSVISGFWTEKRVTESTLLMSTRCPTCLQLKFILCQTFFGVAFPTFLGFAFHLPTADYYKTVTLPDITHDSRNAYKFCFKLLKSKATQFKVIIALQVPLVLLLPYLQEKELDNINTALRSGLKNQE